MKKSTAPKSVNDGRNLKTAKRFLFFCLLVLSVILFFAVKNFFFSGESFFWPAFIGQCFILLCGLIIAGGIFYVLYLISKSDKTAENEVYTGIVTAKHKDFSAQARAGELYTYSFTLDDKKFRNVRKEFYEKLEIGQTAQVETIPAIGEIIDVTVLKK